MSRTSQRVDEYTKIYERCVQGNTDLVGMIAYVIYKQRKQNFIEGFVTDNGRRPTSKEIKVFTDNISNETIEDYNIRAKNLVQQFVNVVIANKQNELLSNVKQPSFWYGILQNMFASFLWSIVLGLIVIFTWSTKYGVKDVSKEVINAISNERNLSVDSIQNKQVTNKVQKQLKECIHIVQAGETILSISQKYSMDYKELMNINKAELKWIRNKKGAWTFPKLKLNQKVNIISPSCR